MAGKAVLIFAGPRGWAVGASDQTMHAVDAGGSAGVEERADATAKLLRSLGHRPGDEVVLGIASEWCLSASIKTSDLPKKDRRQAMLYRLEEKLPLAAEEVVADFVEGKRQALGVCARIDILKPILKAFEEKSVNVGMICPTALLAIAGLREYCDGWLIEREDGAVEALDQENGDLVGWQILPGDADVELYQRVRSVRLGREPTVKKLPGTMAQRAIKGAAEVLEGKTPALVNLRRDGLRSGDALGSLRTPVYAAVAACAALLICLVAAMLWRAHQHNRLAQESEERQRELFVSTFPDQTPPVAIRSRLTSEELRLRGLGGLGEALPKQTPTLVALREALALLPRDLRYRLLEIRVDPDRFQLDGQALSHGDADLIASALRKNPRFTVEAPRSEQVGTNGVSFTISGMVGGAHPTKVAASDLMVNP